MVSIRRRKLLGLCSGRNSFFGPFPRFFDNGQSPGSWIQSARPVIVHPLPSVEAHQPKEEVKRAEVDLLVSLKTSSKYPPDSQKNVAKVGPESSNPLGSSSSKEQHIHQFPEVKRRKRHRRKHFENQEPCVMRGVYFKNMKWQAAIKVEKKQIHLGTVGSQEEAARLYDRAAFMCGREPNFELSDKEKLELSKFNWDEFLALTRSTINSKRHQRRVSSRMKFERSSHNSDWEADQGGIGFSASEEIETSVS